MTRLLTIIALLFATPAWAEQLTVVLPIHDVLGKKGARVVHSHGTDAAVAMTVVLDQKVYLCIQGLVIGKLGQQCMTTIENDFVPIPAD